MYIRLRLGDYYCEEAKIERSYNSLMDVPVDREMIRLLLPKLSPEAWAVYTVFLNYETLKYEAYTPQLGTIKCLHFPSWSRDTFVDAINLLLQMSVNDHSLVILTNISSEFLPPEDPEDSKVDPKVDEEVLIDDQRN